MYGAYFKAVKIFAPSLYRHHMDVSRRRTQAADLRAAKRWGMRPDPNSQSRWTE